MASLGIGLVDERITGDKNGLRYGRSAAITPRSCDEKPAKQTFSFSTQLEDYRYVVSSPS